MIPVEKRSKALAYYYRNRDKLKERCRINAKKRYDQDPSKKLQINKEWKGRHIDQWKSIKANWAKRRFFYNKALLIKANGRGGISLQSPKHLAVALMHKWKQQRGLCALTKQKLTRTAHVDHIVPVSRGGTDHSDNLQWLCPRANQIKHDMTLEELKAYCLLIINNL